MKLRIVTGVLVVLMASLLIFPLLMEHDVQLHFKGAAEGSGDYPPPSIGEWIITSETRIKGETLTVNQSIVIQDGGSLILDNTSLILNASNYGELWISVKNGGMFNIINNSRLAEGESGVNYDLIYENGSSGLIADSEISDCGWDDGGTFLSTGGILIASDNVTIRDSLIHENYMGIITFSASPEITDNEITDNHKYGIILINSSSIVQYNKITFNPVGIYALYARPEILDNDVSDNGDGARFYYCYFISVRGGKFSSNSPDDCTTGACSAEESGKGIYAEASNLTVDGVELSDNSWGLILQNALADVRNSTIRDNLVDGILGENSQGNFSNNLFSSNAEYGIRWMYSRLELDPSNTFSENTGVARVIQEWDVKASVTDSQGDWVSNADLGIQGNGKSYSTTTTIIGMASKTVAEYTIQNDGSLANHNPYTFAASKIATWDGIVYSNQTTENITKNTVLDIMIPLKKPDIFIKEIKFSQTPKVDSEVKIRIKVGNAGETSANNVSIVVTQKGPDGKTSIINKTSFSIGPKEEKTLTFSWTPGLDGKTTVIAELDNSKNIKETNENNNEYEVSVSVSQRDAPLFEDSYLIAGLISIGIILIGIAIYMLAFRKKKIEEG